LEARLETLSNSGVRILDPRQTWVAEDVDPSRIRPGAVLYPGTRLEGARTWIGSKARVGTEGPVTLVDSVLDEESEVASGFVRAAVLLRRASLGANAHVRPGTVLEEEASTAHAVGLKQTILLSFVTLGSVINFCDCLMAGGRSRKDHSEVGSGYIHFNYTPWGKSGDKATPSLVGDVPRGALLRQPRIFLGGTGGLIGPSQVGFGVVAAAGQVLRKDVSDNRLRLMAPRDLERSLDPYQVDRVQPRARKNVAYIGNLVALREWYRQVRRSRASSELRPVIEAAIGNLDLCIADRVEQLGRFLDERETPRPAFALDGFLPCPLDDALVQGPEEHVLWVQSLPDDRVRAGTEWLRGIVDAVIASAPALA
jgi:UDP-N-acetylglucosamine/UDP-N-acetylgalactosamine diphosphorylase